MHGADRVPVLPLRDAPLGGTHSSAMAQGTDKALDFAPLPRPTRPLRFKKLYVDKFSTAASDLFDPPKK